MSEGKGEEGEGSGKRGGREGCGRDIKHIN